MPVDYYIANTRNKTLFSLGWLDMAQDLDMAVVCGGPDRCHAHLRARWLERYKRGEMMLRGEELEAYLREFATRLAVWSAAARPTDLLLVCDREEDTDPAHRRLLPGFTKDGRPLPSEGGYRLTGSRFIHDVLDTGGGA